MVNHLIVRQNSIYGERVIKVLIEKGPAAEFEGEGGEEGEEDEIEGKGVKLVKLKVKNFTKKFLPRL